MAFAKKQPASTTRKRWCRKDGPCVPRGRVLFRFRLPRFRREGRAHSAFSGRLGGESRRAGPAGNVAFAFAGQPGTATTGGTFGTAFGGAPTPSFIGGSGGAGSALGIAGINGVKADFGANGGVGGAAGFYEVQGAWTLTWTVTGTRLGGSS